jgi:dTDP-4-amino-4,6-dideoxygalactose transaminase
MNFKIPLNSPFFDDAEERAVKEALQSGMVSQGAKVEEFEEAVRKYVGAKYAVAVSSCTAGLYLAIRNSMKLMDYDVAIPAFTFPAAQACVKHFGGEVSIEHLDVDKYTYNVDVDKLENDLGEKRFIDAIIPIHQFGLPCDMKRITKLADEREISVIEDAACALGSEYNREKIGKRGTAVFSFHGRKIITTGEGGMVVTDDEELYEKILQGRQYGKDKKGNFVGEGLNFKMSDISAAIGIAQMKKIDTIIKSRSYVAGLYDYNITMHNIERCRNVIKPTIGDRHTVGQNRQSYVVRLECQHQYYVMNKMRKAGIECQVGSYDNSNGLCTTSAMLAATTLALPIWPGMTEDDVKLVVGELERAME